MGHSSAIGEAHYHMVRESDFERAAQSRLPERADKAARNAAQQGAESARKGSQRGHAEPTPEPVLRGSAADCGSL